MSAYTQEDKGLVRIFDIQGNAYIFTGRNRPVYNVQEGQYLKKGQIIATSEYSTAGIDFSGNGVLVMAPNTQVLISNVTKRNLRHIILIAGEIYFRTKNGLFRNRPPGVVTSVRGFPHGYLGKEYKIKFIPQEQSLEVMDKNVSVYPLLALTESSNKKEDTPESFKEGFQKDIDQELDWRELLDEFDSTDTSVKLEQKKKWDLSFILRGVNVEENQFITTDTTTVTSGTGSSADGSNSTLNEEALNPKERYFDARLKFGTRRKKGNGVIIFNGWLEYGNQTDFYREPLQFLDGRKDGRSHLEIAEAYYQFSWLNSDITLGKKVLKAGYSKLFSIMDVLTPKDLYDPLDRRDLGNYLIQFDTYIGDVSLTYALMPYFLPNKAPKRFLSESDQIANSNGELVRPNREYPRSKPSTFQHYLQAKTSLGGWDMTLSLFRGPYQFPAFNQKLKRGTGDTLDCADNACEVVENYAIVDRYSFGFSKLLGKILFYSEQVYQNADSRKDDNWYKYLVGMNWKTTDFDNFKLFENIEYFIEYTKEKITLAQEIIDPSDAISDIGEGESKIIPISSSIESRRDHRNNIIGRFAFQYNDKTKFTANYDFNFEFSDFLQIYGLEYSPKDSFNIRFNYELFELNLTRRSQNSTIQTPFGDLDTSQETEITREFQRYTIRLDYIF